MKRNWVLTILVVSLIFATSSWAQDLYQMVHDRLQAEARVAKISKGDIRINANKTTSPLDHVGVGGFRQSKFDADDIINDSDIFKADRELAIEQPFVTLVSYSKEDVSWVRFRSYISANKFGLSRSFGLNFWVSKNWGLGFTFNRDEAVLGGVDRTSENLFVGPRYRF